MLFRTFFGKTSFIGICLVSLSLVACGGVNDGAGPTGTQTVDATGDGDAGTEDGDNVESGDGDSGSTSGDGDGTSGDGDASGDGDMVDPLIEGPADPPEGYPVGPYGEANPEVGEVVENLTFEGFARIGDGVLVNTGEVSQITLADLRDLGKRYALIHTATLWCPSCRTAADDLSARGDELSALDAVIIELVLEGNSSAPPTDPELEVWINGSDLTVTTVRPGDTRTPIVFPSREYAYVIDMDTMTVVWAQQALFTDPTITELGIEALLEELN